VPSFTANVLRALRRYRREFKSKLPYVRRREYRRLLQRYEQCIETLNQGLLPATAARVNVVMPMRAGAGTELCLFVTHATQPALKAHVVTHVEHLLEAGFRVALIVNTDLALDAIQVEPPLLARLDALYVRQNVGFDFAAWAHGWSLCGSPAGLDRLLWVNDSIVGPLSNPAFTVLMQRLRASSADMVGLTESVQSRHHLQSFFLAFGRRALQSAALRDILDHMYALPTKEMVIDAYETRITQRLRTAGLTVEALFPALDDDRWSSNDTFYHWADLIRAGFPFIKTSVLPRVAHTADARALVPARFLGPVR
jgi:lipopolysaccharide biosynthesis protein